MPFYHLAVECRKDHPLLQRRQRWHEVSIGLVSFTMASHRFQCVVRWTDLHKVCKGQLSQRAGQDSIGPVSVRIAREEIADERPVQLLLPIYDRVG